MYDRGRRGLSPSLAPLSVDQGRDGFLYSRHHAEMAGIDLDNSHGWTCLHLGKAGGEWGGALPGADDIREWNIRTNLQSLHRLVKCPPRLVCEPRLEEFDHRTIGHAED